MLKLKKIRKTAFQYIFIVKTGTAETRSSKPYISVSLKIANSLFYQNFNIYYCFQKSLRETLNMLTFTSPSIQYEVKGVEPSN